MHLRCKSVILLAVGCLARQGHKRRMKPMKKSKRIVLLTVSLALCL